MKAATPCAKVFPSQRALLPWGNGRINMNDMTLRQTVIDELEYEPSVNSAHIGVAVENGVVTLTGHVATYSERTTAERVVSRVRGVRGLAQEIEVRPVGANQTADDEIAKRAANILQWNTSVPADSIRLKVSKGFVTLEGTVDWNYQRTAAESALHGMSGVTGVANLIVIRQKATPADVRQRIERALKRDAELDAAGIQVRVVDGTVTLEGRIDSLADRQIVERAAWGAPGVLRVDDRLHVA
jgi:osmotically-inducible protein OsmY